MNQCLINSKKVPSLFKKIIELVYLSTMHKKRKHIFGGDYVDELVKVELNENPNFLKIRRKDTWTTVFLKPELLYKSILELLFDKVNLFYYTTQRKSCNTLKKAKQDAIRALKNGTIDFKISSILSNLGWNYDTLDISSTVFQGDLCEYLMVILLDIFTKTENMVCKVSLKTSSKVAAFGNDNLFYNYKTKTLYYGEAKFYKEAKDGLQKAFTSLSTHFDNELKFICNHTTEFIAKNGKKLRRLVKVFETLKYDDINKARIIFIMNEDIYLKQEYEAILNASISFINDDDIIVFVPVLSKEKFLNYFKENLYKYE